MQVENNFSKYEVPTSGLGLPIHRPVGQLIAIGDNDFGQLGTSDPDTEEEEADAPPPKYILEDTEGMGLITELNQAYLNAKPEQKVHSVTAGDGFSVFISPEVSSDIQESRKVYRIFTFGLNDRGQLGRDFTMLKDHRIKSPQMYNGNDLYVIKIASGVAHTLAILPNHTAIGFGDNSNGQLGPNIPNAAKIYTQIDHLAPEETSGVKPVPLLNNVIDLAAQDLRSVFLTSTQLIIYDNNGVRNIPVNNGKKIIIGSNYGVIQFKNNSFGVFDLNTLQQIPLELNALPNNSELRKIFIGDNFVAINLELPKDPNNFITAFNFRMHTYIYNIDTQQWYEIDYAQKIVSDSNDFFAIAYNGAVRYYTYNSNKNTYDHKDETSTFEGSIQDLALGADHSLAIGFNLRPNE